MMRNTTIRYCAALAAFILAGTSAGQVGGRSFTTPVSGGGYSPTTPGSTYRNSLVPSRTRSYDYNQNLVVDGNVSGGREFRGPVNYSPRYGLSRGTDLSAISPAEPFIRRSAGSSYIYDRTPGRVQSFYLPRQTVTSVMRGNSSGLTSPHITFPGGTGRFAERKTMPATPTDTSGIYRPRSTLSMSIEELDYLSGRSALREVYSLQAEDYLPNSIVAPSVDELYKPTLVEDQTVSADRKIDETLQPVKPLEPEMDLTPQTKALKDILDQEQDAIDRMRERMLKKPTTEEKTDDTTLTEDEVGTEEVEPTEDESDEQPPSIDSQKARAILGDHETFESLARAKYKSFIADGDKLLKEGKFYKAISSYVLASVWDSKSPEAYLHRAVAHFAAGEYMSSSLFLRRAIMISPEYATEKIDLMGLIGDRDVIDNRIIEAVDWQKRSESGEMAFLLAYVYHQQGKSINASEYMKIAEKMMSGNAALESLKKAVSPAEK